MFSLVLFYRRFLVKMKISFYNSSHVAIFPPIKIVVFALHKPKILLLDKAKVSELEFWSVNICHSNSFLRQNAPSKKARLNIKNWFYFRPAPQSGWKMALLCTKEWLSSNLKPELNLSCKKQWKSATLQIFFTMLKKFWNTKQDILVCVCCVLRATI